LIIQSVELVNDEYLASLDFGERHAIFLAEKLKANLIILDEQEGRKIAASKNLKVIGLLGVLYQAAIVDLIDLAESIERLKKTNFRMSSNLFNLLLTRYQNKLNDRNFQ
jgi:predicted nucleic acid-binding protein